VLEMSQWVTMALQLPLRANLQFLVASNFRSIKEARVTSHKMVKRVNLHSQQNFCLSVIFNFILHGLNHRIMYTLFLGTELGQ
jgi:hypothetical protein